MSYLAIKNRDGARKSASGAGFRAPSLFLAFLIFAAQPVYAKQTELDKGLARIERTMALEGAYQEAMEKLNALLASGEDQIWRIHMDLALAFYGLMQYEKALEYFEKAREARPKGEYQRLVSYALEKLNENMSILQVIEEAKKNEPDQGVDKIAWGHSTMLSKLLAGEYYYPALVVPHIIWLKENMAELPQLYRLSAGVYYSAMHYSKAVEDYKRAIEEEPESAELYKTLADCQVAMGNFDSAGENYDKAVELYRSKGITLDAPEVRKIIDIKNALPRRYKDVAGLVKRGMFFEAEESCKRRISLNPGDYAAMTQLGQIYWDHGKKGEAIKLFRKVVAMVPDYPLAHFFLGRAYVFERKWDKGLKQFDIFEEKMNLLPKMDEETVNFYVDALFDMAYLNITMKNYKEAKKKYEKIIELKSDEARAYYNLGLCYYKYFHKTSKAYIQFQKVIELEPNTRIADKAKLFIDYMRRNPDSRLAKDFSFLEEY